MDQGGDRDSVSQAGVRSPSTAVAQRKEQPKERSHENFMHAFHRAGGGSFGRHMDDASLSSREGRGHFEVYRAGSKTISASRPPRQHEQPDIVIQSLHACCRLPSVSANFRRERLGAETACDGVHGSHDRFWFPAAA